MASPSGRRRAWRQVPTDTSEQTYVSSEALRTAAVENVEYLLRTDPLPDRADLAAAFRTGMLRGRVGAPLPELLAGFRIGFAVFWEMLADEATRSGRVTARELATHVFWKADEHSAALTTSHRDATTDALRRHEQERSALVEALTTGGHGSLGSVSEIAGRLELPSTGTFATVAAEVRTVGSVALPEITSKLRAANVSSAWRLLPEVEVGVVSLPGPDAIHIARRVLGRVLELRRDEQDVLLETLETWLDTGGSATTTGARMFVHPNTVRHRLRRIAEYTGRDLDHPTALAELSTALHALRLLPGVRPG